MFSGLESENTAVGIRHADHVVSLYPQMLTLTSSTSGGCSVGIVRSYTKATEGGGGGEFVQNVVVVEGHSGIAVACSV
jgi:hypothetical protein